MPALLVALTGAAMAFVHPDEPIGVAPPDVLPEDPVTQGELRVEGGGALVLEHTSVVSEVHAGLARVTLTQWFHNPYDEPLEAVYLLPLPSESAVDTMQLTCGGRTIDAWVMEREAARRAYEDAKADGKRAALLEQERDNLFTQSVAGICPGETVEVVVQYVEQLAYEDGRYAWAFPMTVGPYFHDETVTDAERISTPYARTGRDVDVTVYIDEGMPIESMWSDSHDIVIPEEDETGATIQLAASDTLPNRDFELAWTLAGTQPRASVLAHRPDPDAPGYLAVTLEPQILGDLFEPRPRELMFVIDESCSMQGPPFELAKATVIEALDQMSPDDRFNLVRFSDEAGALFPEPQPVTAATRAKAQEWLAYFSGGGTRMERGIIESLTMPGDPERMRLVLMLTDGYVGADDRMFETVREHLGDSRLFSLGIGASPNRYLLEGLAEMGRGDVSYQGYGDAIADTVDAFYGRIAHPAMSDVRIDFGDAEVTEQYPKRIPDLWAGQPVRVVARYEGEGPTEVTLTGIVGTEPYRLTVPIDLPEQQHEHEGVASLWARRKIRDLTWYPRGRSPEQVREEVIDVAIEHHLVSRYTSLIAIDDEPSWCGAGGRSVRVPHEAPEGVAMLGGFGSGGLGGRGSGMGGGGTAYGLGGLGTKGMGSGSSGYGSGHGHFGAKGSGAIRAVAGDPIVLGSLDRSLIDDVIKRHTNRIRYAYNVALRTNPSLAGKVVVRFVIAEDGSVKTAEIKSSTLGDAKVEARIRKIFLQMEFPETPGGGEMVVSYPFLFSPG